MFKVILIKKFISIYEFMSALNFLDETAIIFSGEFLSQSNEIAPVKPRETIIAYRKVIPCTCRYSAPVCDSLSLCTSTKSAWHIRCRKSCRCSCLNSYMFLPPLIKHNILRIIPPGVESQNLLVQRSIGPLM